jgi:hypothetical protein
MLRNSAVSAVPSNLLRWKSGGLNEGTTCTFLSECKKAHVAQHRGSRGGASAPFAGGEPERLANRPTSAGSQLAVIRRPCPLRAQFRMLGPASAVADVLRGAQTKTAPREPSRAPFEGKPGGESLPG